MAKEVQASGQSKRPTIVMKFGGTSLGNAERMQGVAAILQEHAQRANLLVVVSAMGGVTDMLVRAATQASLGVEKQWKGTRQELAHRHREVADQALSAGEQAAILPRLAEQIKHFEDLCSGFTLVREITPRGMDTLSSLGEVMSSTLMAAILRSRGLKAEAVDATDLIVTDDNFGNASPLFKETNAKARERLAALTSQSIIPVITGFRGATAEGLGTTLGRGGSDYSATILASAVDADEVWIWTDVDGVMTADPRLVPEARILPEISYREAIELSFFGAKVLHPKTIQPVMNKQIPVWIKNSFNPSCPGTKIVAVPANGQSGVKAITSVKDADLITISSRNTLSFPQLAARVFEGLALEEVSTLVVTQSSADNVLSFAIHHSDFPRVKSRLEKIFELEMLHDYVGVVGVLPKIAIVVMVGEHMKGTPGIAGNAFGALGRQSINIIAIAQGSSEISISFALKASDMQAAVKAIHEEFHL